mgnify:CR=1 FL=1
MKVEPLYLLGYIIRYMTTGNDLLIPNRTLEKGSSELIRYVRRYIGVSQAHFARQLGVAVHTISRWETGVIKPPLVAQLAASYLFHQFNESRSKVGLSREDV